MPATARTANRPSYRCGGATAIFNDLETLNVVTPPKSDGHKNLSWSYYLLSKLAAAKTEAMHV